MRKIKIGIIGTAEIAFRRFMPALLKGSEFEYIGVASRSNDKAEAFVSKYGGHVYSGYQEMIDDEGVEAIYLPLPPALHFEWALKAIEAGKHILLEKPFTISLELSKKLISKANENNVVVFENYMFQYHSQIREVIKIVESGRLGTVRLIRSSFGFPMREINDFRYDVKLGGGALLDAGGYVVRLGSILLGETVHLNSCTCGYKEGFEVDFFGELTLSNNDGQVYQGAYGMDCHYQCNLEIWGSEGKLSTNRIYTAPPEVKPIIVLERGGQLENIELEEDDHFCNSIRKFYEAITEASIAEDIQRQIIQQATIVDQMKGR